MIRSTDIEAVAADTKGKERNYWLGKLAGELVKTGFPPDAPGSCDQRCFDTLAFKLPIDISSKAIQISKNSDPRLFVVLLTGWVALLKKYTGHHDIIVGAPVVKQDADAKFINTVLVLRNMIENHMTFKDLLLTVRQTASEAAENQNYPLNILLYELNISYSEKEFPLFNTAILLENIHDKSYMAHIPVDMTIQFTRTGTGEEISGYVEYNNALYGKQTIEQIVIHFSNLLRVALFNPESRLSEIDILSDEEKNRLIFEFNNITTDYARHKTLHEIFTGHAEARPDVLAAVYEQNQISYRELNKISNCLAGKLKARGVKSGSIVALFLDRSLEMMVAIMAVLKAGAAYLPISLKYPPERVGYVIKDSQAEIFITRKSLFDSPGSLGSCVSVDIEAELFAGPGTESNNTANAGNAHDVVYVIYTSGSTGKPKGVVMEHRSVANLIAGLYDTIYRNYGHPLRVCLVAPYEFDASAQQIFGAFLQGHSLYIVPDEARLDGAELANYYEKYQINISDGTPSHIRLLLEGKKEKSLKLAMKHFIIAGEAFPRALAEKFFTQFGNIYPRPPQVSNIYGPTETCVDSTFFHISPQEMPHVDILPIGKPLPNQQVYILDKEGALLPIGVPGELCIGGDGVGRGYLNQPELTAEKFKFNRSYGSNRTNVFFYKTGDLARWLRNGNIEFIGRLDHQVKLRGYRIELGEIENQLQRYGLIKECILTLWEDKSGEKQLAAYVVPLDEPGRPQEENGIIIDRLRSYCKEKFPEYMTPSSFMVMDKLPLTGNGKIDKKALPLPELGQSGLQYEAPRNAIEEKLAAIWSDILDIEKSKIGIDNDFFDLGGHSLKATQLISRIHKSFNVKLPLIEIFHRTTIRKLAEVLPRLEKQNFISIMPVETKEFYPLSSTQKRLFVVQCLDAESTAYNMAGAYVLTGSPDIQELEKAFIKLIARHESFRTSFQLIAGEPVQKIHEPGNVPFKIDDYDYLQDGVRAIDIIPGIIQNFTRAFVLSVPPLLRVGLIKLEKEKYILMVDTHHIITDGASQGIFVNDLLMLYLGKQLPPLRLQYKDFSNWQNEQFETGAFKKQEAYWLGNFPGDIPVLEMPTDYPRPQVQQFTGSYTRMSIDREISRAVRQVAAQTNATVYMFLLAAYYVLLAKYSGQEDIVVGSPIIGRRHADLENIIGMFVNTLALRNGPQGGKRFRNFLEEVIENSIKAFENQDYPLDELVERLAIERSPGRNPLFDVMFSYSEMPKMDAVSIESTGLQFSPYEFDSGSAKFDLNTEISEDNGMLVVMTVYCTRLFKKETIERMTADFSSILEIIAGNIDIKIEDIELESVKGINPQYEEVEEISFNI